MFRSAACTKTRIIIIEINNNNMKHGFMRRVNMLTNYWLVPKWKWIQLINVI